MPFTSTFYTQYKHVHTTRIHAYTYECMHVIVPNGNDKHNNCVYIPTCTWICTSPQASDVYTFSEYSYIQIDLDQTDKQV